MYDSNVRTGSLALQRHVARLALELTFGAFSVYWLSGCVPFEFILQLYVPHVLKPVQVRMMLLKFSAVMREPEEIQIS